MSSPYRFFSFLKLVSGAPIEKLVLFFLYSPSAILIKSCIWTKTPEKCYKWVFLRSDGPIFYLENLIYLSRFPLYTTYQRITEVVLFATGNLVLIPNGGECEDGVFSAWRNYIRLNTNLWNVEIEQLRVRCNQHILIRLSSRSGF